MKTQINIFANLLLSEKYCANKGTAVAAGGRGGEGLKRRKRMQNM